MVLYVKDKKIIGGCNEEYLLEAIRVTDPNEHERNYHIFYQLLYGGSDEMLAKWGFLPAAWTVDHPHGCMFGPASARDLRT